VLAGRHGFKWGLAHHPILRPVCSILTPNRSYAASAFVQRECKPDAKFSYQQKPLDIA